MIDRESVLRIRVAEAASGARTYLVDAPPEALPPVRGRDLLAAWENARSAALADGWGRALLFRFRHADSEPIELALADTDACCWAAAVDRTIGLGTLYGMSVCLRLLALIDLLAQVPWAVGLIALKRDGASLHPGLVDAAASAALTRQAVFDPDEVYAVIRRQGALSPPHVEPESHRIPTCTIPSSRRPGVRP